MGCRMGATVVQLTTPILESDYCRRIYITPTICHIMQHCNFRPRFSGKIPKLGITPTLLPRKSRWTRRDGWIINFALDTGGTPESGGQDSINNESPGLGQTRLGRIVTAGGRQLLEKLNAARRNFPMKVFLLLLGFYTANALATILGQTGDWDVLVAGVVVAAIEGIGMLMYRNPPSLSTGRLKSFVVMVNYWKAGVCLGLFVDAFKLGS
ncbi:PREDICTED: ycf20-like protein isoform X1 [Nelumbo nucifera]|uniref:Ycf20-like protein isoform X1 n=1 Tax=Nelumbo nucifera TaxID=4432 RepID=A0A1U8B9D7_NELNU|nr:PREDICTED: ycf20-like protein isoform X1 [Nelumbo nucifera]